MNTPCSFPLPTIVAFIGSLYLLLPISAFAQKTDLKKGLQLLSSKQLGAAQEFFEDIIKTDSTHTAAYFAPAQTYFEQYKTLWEQQKHQVRL